MLVSCQEGWHRPALSLFTKVSLDFSCKLPKATCFQKFAFAKRSGAMKGAVAQAPTKRPELFSRKSLQLWSFDLTLTVRNETNTIMTKLLSCRYNMDTNRVEARFEDETVLSIDCAAVEDEYGNTLVQRAELDWLLCNKPLEYAQLVLGGGMEHYLSLGCDHGRLED